MLKGDFEELQMRDALFRGNNNCVVSRKDLSEFTNLLVSQGTSPAELLISDNGVYQLHVLFKIVKSGNIQNESHLICLLHDISNETSYSVCPGLGNLKELIAKFEKAQKIKMLGISNSQI